MSETDQTPYQYIVPVFEDVITPDYIQAVHDLGATTMLLCIRESDVRIRDRMPQLYGAVEAADALGMETWTDPWSLAGMFGGEESLTWVRPEDRCPDNPEVQGLISDFLHISADLGAEAVLYDEPKLHFCGHKGSETPYLRELSDKAGALGMGSVICMLPSDKGISNAGRLAELAAHPDVRGVGVDPYYNNYPGDNNDLPDSYVGRVAAEMVAVEERTGVAAHSWVQGFGIPMRNLHAPIGQWYRESAARDWSEVPYMAAESMVRSGLNRIGFWGSRDWGIANQNAINIRPAYPERVWEAASRVGDLLRQTFQSEAEAA